MQYCGGSNDNGTVTNNQMRWTGMGRKGLHSAQQQNCWTWNHVDCNVVSRSGVASSITSSKLSLKNEEAPKNCKWIESPQTLPTKLLSITTALQIVRLDDFMECIYCQPNEQNWNVNGGLLHFKSETTFHMIQKIVNLINACDRVAVIVCFKFS